MSRRPALRNTKLAPLFQKRNCLRTAIAVMATALCIGHLQAQPSADINNGTVRLGVNKDGSLIITPTVAPLASADGTGLLGVRLMATNYDGSAAGTPVDGWGVGDTISGNFGTAVNAGPVGLTGISQTSTASTANCTVTAGGIFQVTHDFHPSVNPNAYEITVTIRNISAATVRGRYRRTLDWDIEPTRYFEYITIQGATLSGILNFTDDALLSPQNPLMAPAGINGDVVNRGPNDLGATITYDLGLMAPGASIVFQHYYGAAPTRAAAMAAITALGLQGYTLAQPSTVGNPASGAPNTFFYGFYGSFIGTPPPPPPLPKGKSGEGTIVGARGPTGAEGGFGFGGGGFFGGGQASSPRSAGLLLGPFLEQYRNGTHMRVLNRSDSALSGQPGTEPANTLGVVAILSLGLTGSVVLLKRFALPSSN